MAMMNPAQFGKVASGSAPARNIPGWPGTFNQPSTGGAPKPALNIPGWPGTFGSSAAPKPSAPSAGSAPARNIPGWPGTFQQPSAPKNPALNIPGWPGTFGGKTAPAAPSTPASSAYTIQRGDNLSSIAASHGTTLGALRSANPQFASNPKYNNGNMIFAGGKVNIPGASSMLNNQQMKNAAPAAPSVPRPNPMTAGTPRLGGAMTPAPAAPGVGMMGSIEKMPYTGGGSIAPIPNQMLGNKPTIQPL